MDIGTYGIRIIGTYPETIVDGEGLRYAIYLAGCRHRCPKCHNPQSWNHLAGEVLDQRWLEEIVNAIQENPLLDGVTISGGDPFFNPTGLAALLRSIHEQTHQSIWCYTGYTIEQIAERPALQAPLPYIDVLVDGPYIDALADPSLRFRGSSNQRIIHQPLAHVAALRNG